MAKHRTFNLRGVTALVLAVLVCPVTARAQTQLAKSKPTQSTSVGLTTTEIASAEPYPSARGETLVIADRLDRFNLFKRRLFNRQLFEQLDAPEQTFRLGNDWESVAFAVDASVASTQVLDGEFSRFHGYFIFDTFTALRSPYGVDLNLNLTLFNPSSSDGSRVSADAVPEGNIHFYQEFKLAGQAGRLDVLGIDLGTTTLGNGLILEQWPVEGEYISLALGDFALRQYFAGRVFWPDDDVFGVTASALGGNLEAMLLGWSFQYREQSAAWYVDVSGRLPLLDDRLQASAEYALNLRQRARHALLLRTDYRDEWACFEWHLGYQFRWYQRGFGPLKAAEAASTDFNLPYREEEYVNNSFEYFSVSELFEQWSHGAMAEAEIPLGGYFQVFAQGEVIAGFARDNTGPSTFVRSPQGYELPGAWLRGYYRAGLRHMPWPGLPHRLSMWLTNKQAESPVYAGLSSGVRFVPSGHWISFQLEAFL